MPRPCGNCGEPAGDDWYYVARGADLTEEIWCRDCGHGESLICHACGCRFAAEEACYNNDRPQCMSCYGSRLNRPSGYHASSIRELWPDPAPGDWGIEIEINTQNRRGAIDAAESNNWAAERDGSLPNETGLEMISPPMRFDRLEASVRDLCRSLPAGCSAWSEGRDLNSSFGIHVSFDTRRTSKLSLFRFVRLINMNPMRLHEFCSGRKRNGEYADFDIQSLSECIVQALSPKNKYLAVNLMKPPRCEVRIYRSTLNPDSIVACMEHVRACLDYAKERNPSIYPEVLVRDFWKFIEENPKRYSNFRKRMASFYRNTRYANHFRTLCENMPKHYARLGVKSKVGSER